MASRACVILVVLGVVLIGRPATAQYRQLGEDYRVELIVGEWFPPPDPVIRRDAPGTPGSDINFVLDLGVDSKRFSLWKLTVRPNPGHKLRVEFLPLRYRAEAEPSRSLVYNGATFDTGSPIASSLRWSGWRFGYEYDVIRAVYGYVGVVGEVKYNRVTSHLANGLHDEMTTTNVLIPGVGAIGRLYLIPEIQVTGEVSGFKMPERDARASQYLDYDLSGTLNFTDHIGLQGGTRSMHVRYRADDDASEIEVREKYFAAVIRF